MQRAISYDLSASNQIFGRANIEGRQAGRGLGR
jgi:hypothetical protein